MSLTVKNKSRTLFTLNLPAGLDYEERPDCAPKEATYALQATTPDGDVGVKEVTKTLPAALTWLAGETKVKLPVALGLIPEFKRACDAGILVVVQS